MAGEDLGYAGPAQAASPPVPARRRPLWRDLAVLLLLAAVLTVVIKAFAVEAFRIPSGSMQDTLRVGDRVLVNKLVYRVRGIDRGDVIVFSGQGSWDPPPSGPPPGPVPAAVRTVLQLTGMASERDGLREAASSGCPATGCPAVTPWAGSRSTACR